jgi:hypothetical protein
MSEAIRPYEPAARIDGATTKMRNQRRFLSHSKRAYRRSGASASTGKDGVTFIIVCSA